MKRELKDIDFDILPLGTRIEFENGETYYKVGHAVDDGSIVYGKYAFYDDGIEDEIEDREINKETGFCSWIDSYLKSIETPTSYGIIYESDRKKNIKAEIEQLKQKLREMEEKLDE